MQKSREEIAASIKTGFNSILLLVLSLACFVVFLWIVMTIVRLVAGFAV